MLNSNNKAIGLVRRDIGEEIDLHALAQRHGYRLVFTVVVDTGPLVTSLILAQHIYEHSALAVVVPALVHADRERHMVTDLAALITPMVFYPRGYRWPMADAELGSVEI